MNRRQWKRVGWALALVTSSGCKGGLPDEDKDSGAAMQLGDGGVMVASNGSMSGSSQPSGSVGADATVASSWDAGTSLTTDGHAAQPTSDAATDAGSTAAAASTTSPGRVCTPESLYEPNDSAGNSCWITPNMRIASGISGSDSDDYYSIDLEKGVTYTLDIFHTNSIDCEVTMSIGSVLDQLVRSEYVGGGGSLHREFTPSATGRAVLRVDRPTEYHFTIWDNHLTRNTELEPNNSASTAVPVALGAEISSELGALPEDDVDYFTVPVKANTAYLLHLEHSAPVDRGVTMVGSASTLIPEGYSLGSTDDLPFMPSVDGLALVKIQRPATYKFSVSAR